MRKIHFIHIVHLLMNISIIMANQAQKQNKNNKNEDNYLHNITTTATTTVTATTIANGTLTETIMDDDEKNNVATITKTILSTKETITIEENLKNQPREIIVGAAELKQDILYNLVSDENKKDKNNKNNYNSEDNDNDSDDNVNNHKNSKKQNIDNIVTMDSTTILNTWPTLTTSATPWLTTIQTTLARSTITKAITTAPTSSFSKYNSNQTMYGSSSIHKSSKLQPQNVASRKHHQQMLPKIQRTDAPMLNYIFDSISSANKHHHHDHRYGPHFEDISSSGNVTNITVQVGSSIYLNCRISLLQDKTVSWVRRKSGETNLDLLTVGMHVYSGDSRYKMEFQYPNNWRLKIESAIKDDEGTYECQISTYPPRVIQRNLFVNDPKVLIIDEEGIALQDKYYEVDSTMQLSCVIRHVKMTTSVVYWSHGDSILNYDTNRGGVSVKTEIMEKGANSTLFIAKINKSDSGNYTCSINSSHDFTVLVHVLNEESFAELHHGGSSNIIVNGTRLILLLIIINIISLMQKR